MNTKLPQKFFHRVVRHQNNQVSYLSDRFNSELEREIKKEIPECDGWCDFESYDSKGFYRDSRSNIDYRWTIREVYHLGKWIPFKEFTQKPIKPAKKDPTIELKVEIERLKKFVAN